MYSLFSLLKVFWRGTTTGERVKSIQPWVQYDSDIVDVAFYKTSRGANNPHIIQDGFERNFLEKHYVREKAKIAEMVRYKYLLSIEGNDVATGLKWMLYSNSVVLMAPPTKASWAMEDLLLPFVHYIPLAPDLSNLLDMVEWAEEHSAACKEIAMRSTEYIERLWLSEQAKADNELLKDMLANAYVSQFQEPLSQCLA